MADIVFDQVAKAYGSTHVIPSLDLAVADGSFTVLLGPSGCGKSTLLRMIAGLEAISGGELRIDGRIINEVPPAKRGCAMVFQNYALYPHLTVRGNLSYPLRMARMPKALIAERVTEMAETLELTSLLDRYPRQLSGGQRQRVAMGRAMVRRPEVLLYDEPLSNLDLELRVRLRLEIAEMHRRLKTTVVYVTHDQSEAMTLADNVVVLRDGKIEQFGAPKDLYERPANTFVAGFIGTPKMNFWDVDAVHETDRGTELRIGTSALRLPLRYATPPVQIGVRPERCHLTDSDGTETVRLELLETKLVIQENLGDRVFGYLSSDKGRCSCLMDQSLSEEPSGTVILSFEPQHVLCFDESGTRIDTVDR